MAAYRADIEIAVKGGRQLAEVSERIGQLSKQINQVNKAAKLQGAIPASVNNYRFAVEQANAAVRAAAAGTTTQKRAIDLYVKSLAQAEKAELNLATAIKRRQRELNLGTETSGSRGGQRRFAGVASNAIIGGAFPLLFGQGAGAATGGAIGGAVGGLFGGTGGFAGSLLGTLIGDLTSQANQIKSLGEDIGFSAQQTQQLADAFKQAGTDFDKFQDSVQNIRGLGLSIEDQADAVRLVSTLTDTYGGKIDKVTNAFTSALESGKVTQATLNQLTSQGIPIQDELAKKYGISRNSLLQMAKDGKISVQSLADTLVDMGNKGLEAGEKPRTAFDNFTIALTNTGTAIGNVATTLLTVLSPAIDTIIIQATRALNILTETINTELLRTKIQNQSGKILSPAKLKQIESEAMSMAARRYPSEAKGRQLAAGSKVISPRAQAEFQVLREQMIRNELKTFGYESGILTPPKPTVTTQIGKIQAPSQLPSSGGKSESDKAARAAARLAEDRKKQLEAAARMAVLTEGELQKTVAVTEQEKLNTEYAQQRMERMLKYETLYREALSSAEIEYLLMAQSNEIFAENIKYEEEILEIQKEQTKELYTQLDVADILGEQVQKRLGRGAADPLKTAFDPSLNLFAISEKDQALERTRLELEKLLDPISQVTVAAEGIGSAFSTSFTGIVSGTMTAQEALAGFFQNIADQFLDMAAQIIAKWIQLTILNSILKLFPGSPTGSAASGGFTLPGGAGFAQGFGMEPLITLPGRAAGGPVSAGSPYIVGEKGPELFVPGKSGTIVPNNKLGSAGSSNVVVNVDASGSKVQGDDTKASQLGSALAAAVQAEIIKQKKPGGLLY